MCGTETPRVDQAGLENLVQAHARAQSIASAADSGNAGGALVALEGALVGCPDSSLDAFDHANITLTRARLLRLLERDALPAADAALLAARSLETGTEEDRLLVQALLEVGDVQRAAGSYDAARVLIDEALCRACDRLGTADSDTASAYNSLGVWARYRGEVDLARDAYRQALDITTRAGDQAGMAGVLHNAASLEQLAGNAPEALALIQQAMALRADDERGRDADRGVWAVILTDLGQFTAAAGIYTELAERTASRYGPLSEEVMYLRANEAVLLHRIGDLVGAQILYDHALGASERLFGPNHPQTATICVNSAQLALEAGSETEAFGLAERAASILRPLVTADLPALAAADRVLSDLGR